MSFLRPQAVAELQRWREALAGGAVAALGLYWATGLGLIRWTGVALLVLGALLIWSGIQRARFRAGHGGLGVVQVDERQIAYLSPLGGGFVSVDALIRVEIGPDRSGFPVWRFHEVDSCLTIPASAEGTGDLYEALAALPGVDMQAAIRASAGRPDKAIVIWRKSIPMLH
jgi:hypothetical protein